MDMEYLPATGARAEVRPYRERDIPDLIAIQQECFPPPYPAEQLWNPEQLRTHIARFPDGALCAVVAGQLAGSATAMRVHYNPHSAHTWADVTDNGYIRTHDPTGDYLYGVDIAVRPAFRQRGIARALLCAGFDLARRLGLSGYIAGARLPGYWPHAAQMSVDAYAQRVIRGDLTDPVLTPQLRCGLRPVQVLHDYLPDAESANAAVLMAWLNPDLPPAPSLAGGHWLGAGVTCLPVSDGPHALLTDDRAPVDNLLLPVFAERWGWGR